MPVKYFTIPAFLLLLSACGREVEVHSYTEINQLPPPTRGEADPAIPSELRAGPLGVAPVAENLPSDHPALPGAGLGGAMPPSGGAGSGGPGRMPGSMRGREGEVPTPPSSPDVAWEVPDGWQALPASGMRLASFRPENAGDRGIASLIMMGPGAGGLAANVERWRGQVDLPEEHVHDHIPVEGALPYTLVNLVTESAALDLPSSTIAAVYELPNRTMFLKFTGETDFLVEHKSGFLRLAHSMTIEGESR